VPNEPQPGHFPSQRAVDWPHSVHANFTDAFATRPILGTEHDGTASNVRDLRAN
jgi:hypothetical protein